MRSFNIVVQDENFEYVKELKKKRDYPNADTTVDAIICEHKTNAKGA